MTELKLCPFCGRYPKFVFLEEYLMPNCNICCDCGVVLTPEKNMWFGSKEEAAKVWNKRINQKQE